ncbi:MAG: ThuA domain-containing protein [Candidatus Sumerlaeota bacterium]|nr:ThuA domain-containing protein [Candidatus Sumerlaeota bacterium]
MTNLIRNRIAHIALCLSAFLITSINLPAQKKAAIAPPQEAAAISPDQAFEQLKTYDDSQPRKPLLLLELHISGSSQSSLDSERSRALANNLANIVASFLFDPKCPDAAKTFAAKWLPLVATDHQLPVLKEMLDNPKTADLARQSLEIMPGDAAANILREALTKSKDLALIGVINSLGARRDAKSVAALTFQLNFSDPQVSIAAARALGKIGTVEAADALSKVKTSEKTLLEICDAQLHCAQNLLADNKPAAEAIYRQILAANPPPAMRLACLGGMVKVNKDAATPFVLEALSGADSLLMGSAIQLTKELPDPKITAALVEWLAKLKPEGKALVMDVLTKRGDRSAAGAVLKYLDDQDEAVRAAAVRAMSRLGDASQVERLALVAANEKGDVQDAARKSLGLMAGNDVEQKMLALAGEGQPAVRVEILRALAGRHASGASQVLLKGAGDGDEKIRVAALDALAVLGQAEDYPKMVAILGAAQGPAAEAAEKAVGAVGARMANQTERAAPLLSALKEAAAPAKPALLRSLGLCGGAEALAAVKPYLKDSAEPLREAAARAICNWPDTTAAPDQLALIKDSKDAGLQTLAMRGYLRLALAAADETARMKMLADVRPAATTAESKRMLLSGLADTAGVPSLEMALSYLGDADARAEADLAARKIAKSLAPKNAAELDAAIEKFKSSCGDADLAKRADAILAQASAAKAPKGAGGDGALLKPNKARNEARKKDIAARAPKGFRVAAYLDCGPDTADGAAGAPAVRQLNGKPWQWPGAEANGIEQCATAAYDTAEVAFECARLNSAKEYKVGMTVWDVDNNKRAQSVWMSGGDGKNAVKIQDKFTLPNGAAGEAPKELTLAAPRDLYKDGNLRVTIKREGQSNCVVCELWLLESGAESAAGSGTAAAGGAASAPAPASAPASAPEKAPAPKLPSGAWAGAPVRPGTTPILIVTGDDYPGHKWKLTAPTLAEALKKDTRLDVRLTENPDDLALPAIHENAAIVLPWMNWQKPDPGEVARANLKKFVESGKGLVLVHFACGAFQEWPEFRNLAGRSYNPKLRGHDPFGDFKVEITDANHPIMKGMKDFETKDELYTCIEGDKPIQILAKATSKVDKKDYPMAFVLDYGKGRVFHSVLGHDVPAIENPPVAELYRRATAWSAGLPPAPEK